MNNIRHGGFKGQSLVELVIGVGLLVIVAGALAVVTINSLRNTQFSKNQVQATKLAQENIEKVRAIKNLNYGICVEGDMVGGSCSTWEDIWATQFGSYSGTCAGNCFNLFDGTANCLLKDGTRTAFCLKYSTARASLNGFTSQIRIEDEGPSQKKITSQVYWMDSSGEHSSNLVTVLTRI